MSGLTCYIDGIGLLGPSLGSWADGCRALAASEPFRADPTILPAPSCLPPNERRRCGPIVKLTLAIGQEAAAHAGRAAAALPTVFSASGGDGQNCHELCQTLASDDPLISPTRFHNSVHNAAAGYWSIALGAMTPSSVLCAYDASFGAGLLESMVQVTAEATPVLLIAYDTPYPEPLRAVRPIPEHFGIALVLSPVHGERSLARIVVRTTTEAPQTLPDVVLEQLRQSIPAARGLPLLQSLARRRNETVTLAYHDFANLAVEVCPCN